MAYFISQFFNGGILLMGLFYIMSPARSIEELNMEMLVLSVKNRISK